MFNNFDLEVFSADYSDARKKFLAACSGKPGRLSRYEHSLSTEDGQPLSTDVFWLGEEQAEQVLTVISATHGIEGFCGSAAQIDWLRHAPMLQNNTALLFIHALNPFGFAYLRRVNEDNIDLNRNFIDFSDCPTNTGYRELAEALFPVDWNETTEHRSWQTIDAYRQIHGQRKTEEAISGGQYEFPFGLFYGGITASWSRRVIERIARDFDLENRQRLAVVDIHSGLGPYGYGELISDHPAGTKGAAMAKCWFGDSVTEPALGTSSSVPKQGLLDYAWHQMMGDRGCYITLEFGTFTVEAMFEILRKENYFWHTDLTSRLQNHPIRKQIRAYFYPEKRDWQEMILFRSRQVMMQALEGLTRDS